MAKNATSPAAQVPIIKRSPIEELAIKSTNLIGSTTSLVLHTLFFIGIFGLVYLGISVDQVLLILTTAVSLEAIYLSIFIQMSVNRQAQQIAAVSGDVVELSEDIDDIQEEVEEISEDVEAISKDLDVIHEDVKEISDDVEEISEEVGEISDDVGELSEEIKEDPIEEHKRLEHHVRLAKMESTLVELLEELRDLEKKID